MPVIKSAKKKLIQDRKRTKVNQPIKTRVQKAIIDFRKNPNPDNLKLVYRLIDQTTKKHIFKKNKASRLKSRLAKVLQKSKITSEPKTKPRKSKRVSKKS